MNLGIIAASIAACRPLFANLGSVARAPSDTIRGPYASDRPFLGHSNASGPAGKPKDIVLSPMGITKTTNVDIRRKSEKGAEEDASPERV